MGENGKFVMMDGTLVWVPDFSKQPINNDAAIDFIIKEEGFLKKPKDIGDGKITIGSGLTDPKWIELYKSRGNKWSDEDNRMAVAEEVQKRREWNEENVPNWERLSPSAQNALLSYRYNYNYTRDNSPKLFKALEDFNLFEAAKQMNTASGNSKFTKGLGDRREREQNLFLSDYNQEPSIFNTEPEVPVSTKVATFYPIQLGNTVRKAAGPYKDEYIVTESEKKRQQLRKAFKAKQDYDRIMEATNLQNTATPLFTSTSSLFAKGGLLEPKDAWDRLSIPEKADIIKVGVKHGIFDLQELRRKYNEFKEGGNIYDGESEPTQKMQIGKPYYSYDENGRKIDDTLNYNISFPEVVIIPDSKKSPAERAILERERRRNNDAYYGNGTYNAKADREQTELEKIASQKAWETSTKKQALDYAQAAATGIGIGADMVSGLPIYSSLKGASVLSQAETPMDYVEGGLWLAPVLGGAYQTTKPAVKQALNLFRTDSPSSDLAGITQHSISNATKSSGLQETQQAAERGRNKLLDWINSSFYKQRIEEEPFYRFSNDIVDEASSLVENAPLGFDKTIREIHPSGQITGETVTRPALKIRDDGYKVFDLNTGLDVNIGSDLGNEAEDVTLHELLHYLTVNSKGIPESTSTMQIVDKGWMQPLEALFNPVGKNILRGKKWQSYILDQNDALLPKYDTVVDMVMNRPDEAKAALLKAGRTEAQADVAIKSLQDRYAYWADIQEQRAHLQELFISKIKPHLKNPNDAAEIESFLSQHPEILENSAPYNYIQEVRPGSLKQYAGYFASALSTLPFINKLTTNEQ